PVYDLNPVSMRPLDNTACVSRLMLAGSTACLRAALYKPLAYARGTVPINQSKHGSLFQQSALGEPFNTERARINETLPLQDQITDDPARSGRMHHAVPAESVGEEQSLHARRGADDRVVIGADFVHSRPTLFRVYGQVGELRDAIYGERQNLFEKFVSESGLESIGLFFVRPRHQDRFALAAEMEAGRHINDHREFRGQKIAALCFDYLAAQRSDGQLDAGQLRDAGGPRACGVDDVSRRDLAAGRLHTGHGAVFNVDACHRGIEPDADAAFFGPFREAGHYAVGINEAIGRAISAADDVVRDHLRNQLHNIAARNHFGVLHPERLLFLLVFTQVLQVRLGRCAEEIPVRAVIGGLPRNLFKSREEINRVERHLDVDRRGELSAHSAKALAGRTESLLLFAFDDQNVRAARFGKVICDARSDNPAADDDNIRCFYHCALHCLEYRRLEYRI